MIRLRNIFAFFVLESRDWLKYKYEVSAWVAQVLIGAVTYSYVGKNLTLQAQSALQEYGGNFLAYLIVGLAFNDFVIASMNAPRRAINPWNLEWLLTIPASLSEAIFGGIWFRYIISVVQITVYLGFAHLVGVSFKINLISVIIILISLFIGFSPFPSFWILCFV